MNEAVDSGHRRVWAQIAEGPDAHGIVLEDDVLLAQGFDTVMEDGWPPDEVDILKLEIWT